MCLRNSKAAKGHSRAKKGKNVERERQGGQGASAVGGTGPQRPWLGP